MFGKRKVERQIQEATAMDAMVRGSMISQALERGAPQPIADCIAYALHPFDSVLAPRSGEFLIRERSQSLAAEIQSTDHTNVQQLALMLTSAFDFYLKQVRGDQFYTDRFNFGVETLRPFVNP